MRTHLICVCAAALILTIAGCGDTPADYEGADNTSAVTEQNACARLRTCCLALAEDSQALCLSGATSGDEADCTAALRNQPCR